MENIKQTQFYKPLFFERLEQLQTQNAQRNKNKVIAEIIKPATNEASENFGAPFLDDINGIYFNI